jgi:hypothetical protein
MAIITPMKRVAKDKPWALVACIACGNLQIADGRVTEEPTRLPKLRAHLRALLGDGDVADHAPSNTFVVHCAGARIAMFHVDRRTRKLSIREAQSEGEKEAARRYLAMILDQLESEGGSKLDPYHSLSPLRRCGANHRYSRCRLKGTWPRRKSEGARSNRGCARRARPTGPDFDNHPRNTESRRTAEKGSPYGDALGPGPLLDPARS